MAALSAALRSLSWEFLVKFRSSTYHNKPFSVFRALQSDRGPRGPPRAVGGSGRSNDQFVNNKELGGSHEPKLIWEGYKRNHKGSIPPQKTRLRCKRIAGRRQIVGNPCPICKNDIDIQYTDTKLLEQFICPHTGNILEATKTGLCRLQHKKLVAAIEKARDYGLMIFTIPQDVSLPSYFHPYQKPVLPSWNKIEVLDSHNEEKMTK